MHNKTLQFIISLIIKFINYNPIQTYCTMSSIDSVAVSVGVSVGRNPHAISLLEVVLFIGHLAIVRPFIPRPFPVPEIFVGIEALSESDFFIPAPPIHWFVSSLFVSIIIMSFIENISSFGSVIKPDHKWT